ncbi:DNA-binding protein [Brevibacillus parabrevis]|uniref:helix-turn-helix domain-containing protein n=1 Tax=Brevibacillus parabrevis TaxID=54914 RepID=UPI0007AC0F90|nr:helix-turn-helix domain-containing protein [Brevibacillus parabrevis]KZE52444.1 DNA-binding protein [Brevibacillus parabrevis]
MEDIQQVLARNVREQRESKKWSLEKLAELSGVSKTMIGQIERGESSPTITTIWKIANGLKISFTSLIQKPQPDTTVVRKENVQALGDTEAGRYRIYPAFPFEADRRFEMYTVEIEGGGSLNSGAHQEGTEEFLTVFSGELAVEIKGEAYTLRAGDSIGFKADRPHSYRNEGTELVRVSMVIYYPE